MLKKEKIDSKVAVFGTHPAALCASYLLDQAGLRVHLFDQSDSRQYQRGSVLLFPSTLELLDRLELLDQALKMGQRLYHYQLCEDYQVKLDLELTRLKTSFPYLLCLSQSRLEELFLQKLSHTDVKIHRGIELMHLQPTQDQVELHLKNKEADEYSTRFEYVVALDGFESIVRKKSFIKTQRLGYTHNYLMADVLLDWNEKPKTALNFQSSKGYLMMLPLKNHHYRIVCDYKGDQKGCHIAKTHLKKVLYERVPKHLELADIEWVSDLKFSLEVAKNYRKDRIILAGDAAHRFNLLGGDSHNIGFADILNLVWKLSMVAHGDAKSVLLASYSRERKPVVHQMMKNVRLLLEIASEKKGLKRQFTDFFLFFFRKLSFLKDRAASKLSGLKDRYNQSPAIVQKSLIRFKKGLKVGERIFDFWVTQSKSREQKRFFQLTRPYTHAVCIIFDPREFSEVKKLKKAVDEKYGAYTKTYLISKEEIRGFKDVWIDSEKILKKDFGFDASFMAVVRPDRYLGALSTLLTLESLDDYFLKHLHLKL